EETATASGNPRAAANWIRSELLRELEGGNISANESPVSAKELSALIRLIDEDKISGKQGKEVLVEMFKTGKGAQAIVEEKGLVQVSDTGEIDSLIDEVIAANPDALANYRSGKETLFGFFVGQVIKASKGKANPKIVNERLRAKLMARFRSMNLSGNTAIVTGGTKGIGKAIAESLARAEANVVVSARTSGDVQLAIAELTRIAPGRVAGFPCDVRSHEQVRSLFQNTIDTFQ